MKKLPYRPSRNEMMVFCLLMLQLSAAHVLFGCDRYFNYHLNIETMNTGFVKNGIIPLGGKSGLKFYLVVDSKFNELIINRTKAGDPMISQSTWRGKLNSEIELIKCDLESGAVTSEQGINDSSVNALFVEFDQKTVRIALYTDRREKIIRTIIRPI